MYSKNTVTYGKIEDQVYMNETLSFDFSDKSPVTFILFEGDIGWTTKLSRRMIFYKRLFKQKLGQEVNVLFIRDSNRIFNRYAANYKGIPGVCDDVFGIGSFLEEKLYTKGCTRRAIVFADCGGSCPAILTSSAVHYHSMSLTTPYLKIFNSEQQFDINSFPLWYSKENAVWGWENYPELKDYFDLMPFLDRYVNTKGTQLNLHWATNIVGTDLLFRNTVRILEKKQNVKIYDHILKPGLDGHLLRDHLIESGKYFKIMLEAIRIEFASLNIETKNIPENPS